MGICAYLRGCEPLFTRLPMRRSSRKLRAAVRRSRRHRWTMVEAIVLILNIDFVVLAVVLTVVLFLF